MIQSINFTRRFLSKVTTVEDLFGKITPPPGTPDLSKTTEIDAIVKILNVSLNIIMIVGGFLALFNLISAGYTYMTSGGDSKKLSEVNTKILFTVIGLVVLILAPVGAAIIGIIIFKDATAILSPKIQTIAP